MKMRMAKMTTMMNRMKQEEMAGEEAVKTMVTLWE
jgi:hypothetical protein